MTPGEELRLAAGAMREHPEIMDADTVLAIADWLATEAEFASYPNPSMAVAALKVARAYLGTGDPQ